MRIRRISLIFASLVVALLALVTTLTVWAGDPDSPGGPTSDAAKMYTLEDIYNRINDGTRAISTTFREPSSGPPTGTMHTLNDIYDLASERSRPAKTGQTTSYATGDDGDLEKGVSWPSTRFITSTTGIVTDTLTGLIWLENANCFAAKKWKDGSTYPALEAANTLNSGKCGLTDDSSEGDWRLPNVRELHSLIDFSQCSPALPSGYDTYFTGVQPAYYWSSTTSASSTDSAYVVNLDDGYVGYQNKADTYYVWPVRGGQ